MAGEQRKCARCRFFKDAGIAGNGWCTHPKRQLTTDAMLLVRAGELACRNDWGGDLFQSRDEEPETADTSSDLPGQSDADRDDEVTSVITRPERPSNTTAPEDRIVSDRPVPSRHDDDDDPWNDAAHREQEERAHIIARGSRDALLHARQRHSTRRSRGQADVGTAESDADHGPIVPPQPSFTSRKRSRFSAPACSTDPVPKAEIESRQSSVQERFDSVPPIDPNFDLPGRHDHLEVPSADPPQEQPSTSHGEHVGRPLSSYEYALNRARRTRQARQHKHRLIRHARPNRAVSDETPVDSPEASTSEDQIVMVPEPGADTVQAAGQLPDVDIEGDVETAEEPRAEPVAAEAEDIYADEPEVHEHPQDLYGRHEDDPFDDDYDDWHEDDAPTLQPERRHGGRFSRFIPGRRHPEAWHDESMITRHTEVDAGQESKLYVPAWDDTPVDDELPLIAEAAGGSATAPARRWSEDEPEMKRAHVPAEGDVAHDNTRSRLVHLDESNAALIPGLVPAARPRQEPMHRQRMLRELPDLDDNLFGEHFDRIRQEQRAAHAVDREPAPAHGMKTSTRPVDRAESRTVSPTSPQDSYFRAAKHRDWRGPRARVIDEDADERPVQLPDLEEHNFDLREVVARGGELMDMTIEIAPEIPRECRTCRSFRSADGGARGWCTNEWAFTHRRMVNEDDLACDSTIGCWWLPADRYWLIEERDSFAATPRMDELIARRYPQEPEREGVSG